MSDDLLTQAEIAALARCSERSVLRWRKRADFPMPICPTPLRGRVLFRRAEIERYLALEAAHG